jgi:2-amino-4-hydroxy-6-hydroxymethyldihydropteridine diphosphokinase
MPTQARSYTAYIALGSNMPSRMGDPSVTLHAVLRILANWGDLAASPLLTTKPWGNTDQPPFQNAVARLETKDSPEDLLQRLHLLEEAFGRDRRHESFRWQPRCLDLDLIFYGSWDIPLCRENLKNLSRTKWGVSPKVRDEFFSVLTQADDTNNVFHHTRRDTTLLKLPHALWAERPFVKDPLRLLEPRYTALIKDVVLHSY